MSNPQIEQSLGLARAHAAAGRLREALQSFEMALSIDAQSVDVLVEYSYALKDAGLRLQAQQRLEEAQTLDPGNVRVLNALGLVQADLNLLEQSFQSFRQALELAPNHPGVLVNASSTLLRLGKLDEAISVCERALAAQPEFGPALISLSLALAASSQPYLHATALELLARTSSTNPTVMQGKAIALQQLNRHHDALDLLKRAAALSPDDIVAAALLSTQALRVGDFETGWARFEARWSAPGGTARPFADQIQAPIWDGSAPLRGQSIFIYAEQGLGDTIQFSRYCALLNAQGARVSFAIQEVLEPVLRGLEGVASLLTTGQQVAHFDLHCPIMSLPRAFATRIDTIPALPRLLTAPSIARAKWTGLLGPLARPRVALAWRGNAQHSNDHHRSMSLATLLPIFDLEVDFISLQRDTPEADQALQQQIGNLHDFGPQIDDFGDLAAIMELCSVVISVDSAPAHLAGAMGRPTWLCLPRPAEWRWLLERDDSPWYPSVHLYRQREAGHWSEVVASLQLALRHTLHLAA